MTQYLVSALKKGLEVGTVQLPAIADAGNQHCNFPKNFLYASKYNRECLAGWLSRQVSWAWCSREQSVAMSGIRSRLSVCPSVLIWSFRLNCEYVVS